MGFVHNPKRTLKFPSTLIPVGHKTKNIQLFSNMVNLHLLVRATVLGKWFPTFWRKIWSTSSSAKWSMKNSSWDIFLYNIRNNSPTNAAHPRRPLFSFTTVKTFKPIVMILFHSADILHNDGDFSPCFCKEDVTNINQINAQDMLGLI